MHQKLFGSPKSHDLHRSQVSQLFGQRTLPIFELDLLRENKQQKQDKYRQLLGSLEEWNNSTEKATVVNNYRRQFHLKNFVFSSLQLSSADLSSNCTRHILSALHSFHRQNTLNPIQIEPNIKSPRASDDVWSIRKGYRSDLPQSIGQFRRKTISRQGKQNQCKTDKKCIKTTQNKIKIKKSTQNIVQNAKTKSNACSWRKYYELGKALKIDQDHKSGKALIKSFKLQRNRLHQKLSKNYYKEGFNHSRYQREPPLKTKVLDPISTPNRFSQNQKIKFHPVKQIESNDIVQPVDGDLLLLNPFDKHYKSNLKK